MLKIITSQFTLPVTGKQTIERKSKITWYFNETIDFCNWKILDFVFMVRGQELHRFILNLILSICSIGKYLSPN